MLQKLKIAAIAAGVALAPLSANALIVTHTFSGKVILDFPGPATELYDVGDAAEVILQYDSTTPGRLLSPTNYEIDNISIRFGDFVATTETGSIRIGDNQISAGDTVDSILIQTRDLVSSGISAESSNFEFQFAYAANTFDDESLPIFLPLVSSILPTTNKGQVRTFNLTSFELLFADMRVDTITTVVGATVVPLPAALPLFLSAFGCLALIRVRRKTAGARGHVNGRV